MAGSEYEPITISRRIGAPARVIFPILADPGRHRELDGSGMVRGVVSGTTISAVGDVFVMKMYFDELGDYQMINHVVEYEPDRRISWEPESGHGHPNAEPGAERPARWGQRWSFELTPDGPAATVVTEIFDCSQVPEDQRADIDNGNIWIDSMHQTLERLTSCARASQEQPRRASAPGQTLPEAALVECRCLVLVLVVGWCLADLPFLLPGWMCHGLADEAAGYVDGR